LSLRPASHPPGKPSSKEFGRSGGNPLATWRTIENDLLHDITADAVGSTSQQMSHRSADRHGAGKLPIVLI
jgi:hypothetical protein